MNQPDPTPRPTPDLDARGLPRSYPFKPDWETTPRQVKSMLDVNEDFLLIDCREPEEWRAGHIDAAKLMPLQSFQQHLPELSGRENDRIVIHCHHGGRSLRLTQFLRQQGFTDVKSMAGGIALWNKDIRAGGDDREKQRGKQP